MTNTGHFCYTAAVCIEQIFSMKQTILTIIQLVLALVLTLLIVLQQKGSGLSGVFGGSSNIYSTKRGIDKILHYSTIVVAAVFFALSLVRLVF